ncbi:hypothetical protein ABNF65_20860 [Paenibacillus larvae]
MSENKNVGNLVAYIDLCVLEAKKEIIESTPESILGNIYDPVGLGLGFYPVGCRRLTYCSNKKEYAIIMYGEGCKIFEKHLFSQGFDWYTFFEEMLQYEVKIRKIVIAIDDQKKVDNISDLLERAKRGVFNQQISVKPTLREMAKRAIIKHQQIMWRNYADPIDGRGITLGSDQVRIYENKNEIRYEIQFIEKQAMEFVKKLVKENDLFSIVKEFLHDVFPE